MLHTRRYFLIAIVITLSAVMLQFTQVRADDTKLQAMTIADHNDELSPLAAMLTEIGYDLTRVGQKDDDLKLDDLNQFDVIFVYIHSVMVPNVEKALIDYANGGGRLIVLHHALASAKMANPQWLKFLGIKLYPRSHPDHPWLVSGDVTHTMVRLVPDHFITTNKMKYDRKVEYRSPNDQNVQGTFDAFDLPGTEIFHNQRLEDKPGRVCLFGYKQAEEVARGLPENIPAMEDTSLWYMPTGSGWTFYLQPGHSMEDFANPNFRQLIRNCLDWKPAK